MTRRVLLHTAARPCAALAVLALALTACAPSGGDPGGVPVSPAPTSSRAEREDVSTGLQAVEQRYGVTVGVSLLDTGTGETISYRGAERFGFASTVKVFLAAEFLRRTSEDARDDVVRWTASDIERAGYSPVTTARLDTGLTAAELAEAAVRESDNTATNLVFDRIGGPAELDAALSRLGDDVTDIVDVEPGLNTVDSDSTGNTTTADAFTATLAALRGDGSSSDADTATLIEWMSGNATGNTLVRAGAPSGWTVADKSGGAGGVRNDIAVVTPPGRPPLVLTVLTRKNDASAPYADAAVSESAAVVLNTVRQPLNTVR
ncbi:MULTISPECIES: class A beta-lactamase [Nocardiaceae]|uniref:Beta-lactamase n=1 Tax=Rhodococcoides corynebacterioides TaxID=53972 RepID=A0ABS2KNM9_9NOCA|nr:MULTISPECIES: class A beta-lactamase [Rhodococcus]MBM7413412.1 beta-lactamase class A [Rhodococcus corynebacterioides]MBP1115875.1 beta-lactamase class A [Rhodococcus sp. PvP016]